jgi:hypothetical protein
MPCEVFYRDKFVYADELDLCLFIALMGRIIDHEYKEPWYEKAKNRWNYEIESSGNNLLDLRMDDLIGNPDDLQHMKNILSRLQAEIRSYGEFIPYQDASSVVPATMWYNKDVSTERLCAKIAEIAELLPEHYEPTSTS